MEKYDPPVLHQMHASLTNCCKEDKSDFPMNSQTLFLLLSAHSFKWRFRPRYGAEWDFCFCLDDLQSKMFVSISINSKRAQQKPVNDLK